MFRPLVISITRLLIKHFLRCLLIFSCNLYATQAFGQAGLILGKITDDKFALRGATVIVSGKTTTSNAFGEFLIQVTPGNYSLVVTHSGYMKIDSLVTVHPGDSLFFAFDMKRNEELGEVVIMGSRSLIKRNYYNSAVSVDVIKALTLKETGQQSLIQMMNFSVPSFNISRQSLLEPVTLRGLGPDHVLILLNGIRFHSNYYLNDGSIRGTLGRGSTSTDLNAIPFSGIEKIEILRDGSSAQYGSDAIGGVINLSLKKSISPLSVSLQLSQYYKGDGEAIVLGINQGRKFLKKGTMNLSADVNMRNATHRGNIYEGTVYYQAPVGIPNRDSIINVDNEKIRQRGFDRKTPVSNDGVIPVNTAGALMHIFYPLNSRCEIFVTALSNYRHADWAVQYRFPKNASQVNTMLYPDGFKANAILNSWNTAFIAEAKGKTKNGWDWNLKSIYGENRNRPMALNSNNASQQFLLGANAPTTFHGGTHIFSQQTNTINFTKGLGKNIGGLRNIVTSLGAEYRYERIRSFSGQENSWMNYDSTGRKLGGAPGSGSIADSNTIHEHRGVMGIYADLETDISDRTLVNISGRLENYGSFGLNLASKLSTRYKFSKDLVLRASVGNGYHAPGLQQLFFNSISNGWKEMGGSRIPTRVGIFSNNSEVSRLFGIKQLKAEQALNLSTGINWIVNANINVTVDGYWIQIKNRIILSGRFDRTNPEVNNLLNKYPGIDQVQFIANSINTRNRGLDLTVNGKWKLQRSSLQVVLGANFNRTNLFGPIQATDSLSSSVTNTNTLFNREEITKLEKGQPGSKIILTGNYGVGRLSILLRNTRFGKTAYVFASNDASRDEFFSSKILTDLSVSYTTKKNIRFTAGANNIFDIYPDPLKNYLNRNEGIVIYSHESAPFGYNGGFYFLKAVFTL